jgi:5'-nucleotidase
VGLYNSCHGLPRARWVGVITLNSLHFFSFSFCASYVLMHSPHYAFFYINKLYHSGEHKDIEWEELFDVVIVGASKPGFLTNEYLSLFQVEKSGQLRNIEDKDALSIQSIGQGDKVFQGGHWQDLHKIMQISSGEKVLYVGDHMYSDILRSKRSLGWRTCLIIPELDRELQVYKKELQLGAEVLNMRRLQDDLDEYLDLLHKRIAMGDEVLFLEQLRQAEVKAEELKRSLRDLSDEYNSKFNPTWGQLFKAGQTQSRFAKQVSDYACLYTSRASNLGTVSPNRSFRPVQDFVPHDQILFDSENYI